DDLDGAALMRSDSMPRPRVVGLAVVALLTMLVVLTVPRAQAADEPTGAATSDDLVFGAEAARALGTDLPQVAESIGSTAEAVGAELAEDHTLAVDPNGELLYVDPPAPGESPEQAPAAGAEAGAESAPPTTDPVFSLHSRPGADHTIYLDFDGNTTTGTSWNASSGVDPIVSPPYDIDGDPTSWSSTELYRIEQAWIRAAEDFRPFDVNVTTEDPGSAALRDTGGGDTEWGVRVVTTDDTFSGCGCGGQAYIGSFDDYYDEPAFVYNQSTSGVAEAVSHEVGHTMLLAHDGTSSSGYYTGHSGGGAPGWAPLMGASYYQPVTTFSQGEYFAANNNGASANFVTGW
ncbi:MAG: zinc-dependent metalloprotease family protein, partial [Actinomycetota bacterium]